MSPPTSTNAQNFRFVTSTLNDSDDLNVRMIQSLGSGHQRAAAWAGAVRETI